MELLQQMLITNDEKQYWIVNDAVRFWEKKRVKNEKLREKI